MKSDNEEYQRSEHIVDNYVKKRHAMNQDNSKYKQGKVQISSPL